MRIEDYYELKSEIVGNYIFENISDPPTHIGVGLSNPEYDFWVSFYKDVIVFKRSRRIGKGADWFFAKESEVPELYKLGKMLKYLST